MTINNHKGKKECQHAYRGADTSFTYTREFADGRKKEDTVYESHYRALPQICLVGVEEKKAEEETDLVNEFGSEAIPTDMVIPLSQ